MNAVFKELETKYGAKTKLIQSSWNKGFSRFPRETYILTYDENAWQIEITYVLSRADFSKPNPISTYSDIHQTKIIASKRGIERSSFVISYQSKLERFFSRERLIYRVETIDLELKNQFNEFNEINDFYSFVGTRSSDFIPIVKGEQKETCFEISITFNTTESPDIELVESLVLLKLLLTFFGDQN